MTESFEISNNELLSESIIDNNNINFYLVLGIIFIIVLLLNFYNFKSSSLSIDLNKDPIELIKETHYICPVMNQKTTLSSCIQYPPLNEGFIISVCCKKCIQTIQKSFDNGDGNYIIKEENGMNILYHNNDLKQITPICNEENMNLILELTNNELMN
tara:strand:- start:563 stop:1033 length:471 start_codon:yes stop_codon:yes gene_type:complete